MAEHNDKDDISGVDTTGHEWDGIKELNNPLPRWWLWVLYASIVWAIGYMVVYPAWPTFSGEGERGGTTGTFGWTQYKALADSQKEIRERRAVYLGRFHDASYEDIQNDPELYSFAIAGGKAAFKDNCATCHGTGGAGAPGYPNLNDDEWIWGGTLEQIYTSIKYGIRMHDDAHQSIMPAFSGLLTDNEIGAVTAYVKGLYQGNIDTATGVGALGASIYSQHCAVCHGDNGKGNIELGAPSLADAIWLKSTDGNAAAIASQIRNPKHGMMPPWVDRLDEDTLRQLTIYVHSLGGGE